MKGHERSLCLTCDLLLARNPGNAVAFAYTH